MARGFDLEKTVDRLQLRDPDQEFVTPTQLPLKVVKEVDFLRKKKFLPSSPHLVIVNTHQGLVMSLKASLTIEELVRLFSRLQTTGGKQIAFDPISESIDFYRFYPDEHFSHRLRFYLREKDVVASRIIIAALGLEKPAIWQCKNKKFPVKDECFFIVRDDLLEKEKFRGKKERISWLGKHFFAVHQSVSAVVYKKVVKGSFGLGRMWDHRWAVYKDEKGQEKNATSQKDILGMGPYVSLSFQKFKKKILTQSVPLFQITNLIEKILNGRLRAEEVYNSLTRTSSEFLSRVEIEAKGYRGGEDLAYQLTRLLKRKKIQFKLGVGRKIGLDDF